MMPGRRTERIIENMATKKKPARDVKMPDKQKNTDTKKARAVDNEKKVENLRLKEEIRTMKKENVENTVSYLCMPFVLFFIGLFLVVCYIIPDKMNFLGYIVKFFGGLFSFGSVLIPVCLILLGVFYRRNARNGCLTSKTVSAVCLVISVASLWQLIFLAVSREKYGIYNAPDLYRYGMEYKGGGIIGGFIANFVEKFTGIGAWILFILLVAFLTLAIINITPADMVAYIRTKLRDHSYNANLRKKEDLKRRIEEQQAWEKEHPEIAEAAPVKEKKSRKKAYLAGLDGENETGAAGKDKKNNDINQQSEPVSETADELEISADALKLATGDATAAANAAISDSIIVNPETGEVVENAADIPEEGTVVPDKAVYESVKQDTVKFISTGTEEESHEPREIDLKDIFTEDAVISSAGVEANTLDVLPEGSDVEGAVTEIKVDGEIEGEKETLKAEPQPSFAELYKFPDVDFLQKDPNPATFTVTDELKNTAVKLVETLQNFGVRTKITNICCGPTVTRYELQPELGVRVKSIQNLSDDIALHLAAAGVRIEAPIPGKDAVGIEIPNKSVSTVYLRNLIENPKFDQLKSKLSVGLGMDVAGSPVYMDIAKMPHLLIAGATGMGKSVCINSFIVSLLFKARPDEVKLLLIDPKKVEFALYNGMPHLIVPVVSDPKKAAGSLAWAVNEMERRFQLIEEVGVRNIDDYNKITENDPERAHMPKIVIIIDELADLMMTARDSVETSICRIAQKARAAGMHLIIGTQRPSVDVITGLIKANVPSRIACTVASQTDSRTILDIGGAEKLLGKGDMLYAPVGCMKPIRVQGSFVTDREIESIIEFLKNGVEAEYDHDIMNSIEREAEQCFDKKKGRGGDSEGGSEDYDVDDKEAILNSDDAIFPAIEIAVDANMVSTSFLQRKLSLGYARAGRIVDKLEKIGVVGPYEGSKPRKVLITRQEYLEMKMKYEK